MKSCLSTRKGAETRAVLRAGDVSGDNCRHQNSLTQNGSGVCRILYAGTAVLAMNGLRTTENTILYPISRGPTIGLGVLRSFPCN
jgi:hypothetical protein